MFEPKDSNLRMWQHGAHQYPGHRTDDGMLRPQTSWARPWRKTSEKHGIT